MARIKILSARSIETLPDGFHSDGGNLYLYVRGESRSWVFRYKKAGEQNKLGLGATHTRSLAQARAMATLMRAAILDGKDPKDELAVAVNSDAMTFKEYALNHIESKRSEWRNPKHIQQWQNTLEKYAFPTIGNKFPVNITLADIKDILMPIWIEKTETASRVRSRIELVLKSAAVQEGDLGRINPAIWRGVLDTVLPSPKKVKKVKHFDSVHYSSVPHIMSELRKKTGIAAYCLRFTILTACRSSEVRKAIWSEFDLEKKIWKIPPARMKAEREHEVPLCDEAVEILMAMKQIKIKKSSFVFQGEGKSGFVSDVTVNDTLHSIVPEEATVHGFRSSFRVWGSEQTSTPSAVLELALAHSNPNKVEAAYQRSNLLDLRRKLMTAWGCYCIDKNNVVLLKSKEKAG